MGYCIHMDSADFFVENAHKERALSAIKLLVNCKSQMGGGSSDGERWFSWVRNEEFVSADTFEEAMLAWRYSVETDNDGNVFHIVFEGEKLGDDQVLFNAIAPFVRSGSYIQMRGEDGSVWRWCFDNGNFSEKHGTVVFD